jgi:hypothetical protein
MEERCVVAGPDFESVKFVLGREQHLCLIGRWLSVGSVFRGRGVRIVCMSEMCLGLVDV